MPAMTSELQLPGDDEEADDDNEAMRMKTMKTMRSWRRRRMKMRRMRSDQELDNFTKRLSLQSQDLFSRRTSSVWRGGPAERQHL